MHLTVDHTLPVHLFYADHSSPYSQVWKQDMREIYFDNSSTTKPSQAVVDIVIKTMTKDYGNPSSLHRKGVDAERYVSAARKAVASTLRADLREIVFTSGGTESNNMAIIGAAYALRRRGKRILATSMEHPAVAEVLTFLKNEGFTVEEVPVDGRGRIDLDDLRERLDEDVIVLSTMYVNNEIGAVLPVKEIAGILRERSPHALYHVDAIQAYGKYRIHPGQLGIDLMSASGHKLHGPKGTGFLYIRRGTRIVPLIYGGGQQGGLRSGTENVPGIAGLGVAAAEAYRDFDAKTDRLYGLKERLEKGLREIPDVVIHSPEGREGAPHILHASFLGVGSEVLLHSLEDRGIYISAGSACSTHKRNASPTMKAIGAPKEEVSSGVRFSFSETNTEEEVDLVLQALRELLPQLRRYRAK